MKFPGEATQERAGLSGVISDWIDLTKARIGLFVFFAAWVGAALAVSAGGPGTWLTALEPAFYVFLVGAGSSLYARDRTSLRGREDGRAGPAADRYGLR